MVAILAAFSMSAFAQKSYTQGILDYTISAPIGDANTKVYFTPDSNAAVTDNGQYTVKIVADNKNTYAAILVDISMMSMKKVAILSPTEVAQANGEVPTFTFTPGTETKQINGFACKKVTAKDAKSGSTIDLWVTNDIKLPINSITRPFAAAGGVPVQFTTVQQGQTVNVILKSISDAKVPAGTFGIPPGFDKMSFAALKALGGQ